MVVTRFGDRPSYARDDDAFRAEVRKGWHYAAVVAHAIRAEGLPVHQTPFDLVRSYDDIARFEDEQDLRVGSEAFRVEVKSHRHKYHGPHDFPFPWAFADTAHGWQRKAEKPLAVVLISQVTLGSCVINVGRTPEPEWKTHRHRDPNYKRVIEFIGVPRERLTTLAHLIDWLRLREAARPSRAA